MDFVPDDISLSLRPNVPELTVSELATSLKRTVEESYGRVRVRGELSKISRPASGHLYTALKDDGAVIDAICWRGQLSRLAIKPEEGMEVICTGRLTTYAARSSYQLIIEQMELAGRGAILKMLADRQARLAAEGLFDAVHKKPLPFAPRVVGVITSPTGAVIRDILHRLSDRFPVHVLLWPVSVQGDSAAADVMAAIQGMNHIKPGGIIPRPDVIIVARGGGSFEDLMPFQDEGVVRAAAASHIPLISAVGHETDTTLIDYAADMRAPTPTAAAEMAVPVRADLWAGLAEIDARARRAIARHMREGKSRLDMLSARLGSAQTIFIAPQQKLDHLTSVFDQKWAFFWAQKSAYLQTTGARLQHPGQMIGEKKRLLGVHAQSLTRTGRGYVERKTLGLEGMGRMLESLSFHQVLSRGYAVVRDSDGHVVVKGDGLAPGAALQILFGDRTIRTAKVKT